MTLSISQPHNLNSPPIAPGNNQGVAEASGNSRTTRATPEESRPTRSPSSYNNKRLLQEVKKHFREYAAGADDKYVNFNELKEAAGHRPSTRTFSAQASAVADELLKRSRLLNELDIGVGFTWDGRGLKDQRFDHDNLDHMIGRLPDRVKFKWRS